MSAVRLLITRRVAVAEDRIAEVGAVCDVDPLVAFSLIRARAAVALDREADATIAEALRFAVEAERRRIRARREGRRLPSPGTRVRRVTAWNADGLPQTVEETVEGQPGRRVRKVVEWTADVMPKTIKETETP